MNFTNFQSPFTWRYGSQEMRTIFSEKHKFELWRKIWVALARIQEKAGLVSKKELLDLVRQKKNIDIERILEIENETHHDVVAAIREFGEKTKTGGGKIHLGATSMDIVDNADAIKIKEALELIESRIKLALQQFSGMIKKYAQTVCMGYTHLQPAEPTTVGYRLAVYAQDLYTDAKILKNIKTIIKAKGLKGAVGTRASYKALLKETNMTVNELDKAVMSELGLEPDLIATQVYTRKYDYLVLILLASIAASISKFASDLRILQTPAIGEWSEAFGSSQVGSSAMPFKKNPISAENICSLARFVSTLPQVAWSNAAHSYLERTLDDSANRRVITAEAFLAVDEILLKSIKLLSGLIINKKRIAYNLEQYGPFAATEAIIITAVKNGADRQRTHEVLRKLSMQAWEAIQNGKDNPLKQLLINNKELGKYIKTHEMEKLLDVSEHVGDTPQRALELAGKILVQ